MENHSRSALSQEGKTQLIEVVFHYFQMRDRFIPHEHGQGTICLQGWGPFQRAKVCISLAVMRSA